MAETLSDRIRSEAAIADRPGQMARLEAIADDVEHLAARVAAARAEALQPVLDLIREREAWLLEDNPQPWPVGTIHSALISTDELRAVVSREPGEGDKS